MVASWRIPSGRKSEDNIISLTHRSIYIVPRCNRSQLYRIWGSTIQLALLPAERGQVFVRRDPIVLLKLVFVSSHLRRSKANQWLIDTFLSRGSIETRGESASGRPSFLAAAAAAAAEVAVKM